MTNAALAFSSAPATEYTSSDIFEMEQEIKGIKAQISAEDIAWMRYVIARLPASDKDRLNELLNNQLNTLSETAKNKTASLDNTADNVEALRMTIDSLSLGPQATIEDLRKRDEIVGSISGIKDPDLRYELLERLENKERLSASSIKQTEELG